jgi:FtsH-binding integral membrane protein
VDGCLDWILPLVPSVMIISFCVLMVAAHRIYIFCAVMFVVALFIKYKNQEMVANSIIFAFLLYYASVSYCIVPMVRPAFSSIARVWIRPRAF